MGDEKKSRPYAGSGVSPDAYHAYGAVVGQLAQRNSAAAAGPQQTAPAPAKEKDGAKRTLELKQLLHQLRTSERGGLQGKLGLSNSDKFEEVMHATEEVVELISGRVGSNRKEAQNNATRLLRCYVRMLDACQTYLGRKARTGKGKARQNIVKQLKDLAELDIAGARIAMDQVGAMSDDEIQGASWRDVLLRGREHVINLSVNFDQLETTGGQASKVYKVPDEEGLSFFKEEENYHREFDDEDQEKTRVGIEWIKEQVGQQKEEDKLSDEALSLLASDKIGYNLDRIHARDDDWKKYIGDTPPAVVQELRAFKSKHAGEVRKIQDQAKLGFEIITAPERLNLRLDESKSTNLSRRNVATSRIADLLGIGNVVARSRTVKIMDKGGKSMVGNLMEGAKGVAAVKAFQRRIDQKALAYVQRTGDFDVEHHNTRKYGDEGDYVQPAMQKNLTSLQVLDALCGQQDRHMGNYFVQLDDQGRATGVQGIDNDFAFGRTELDQAHLGNRRSNFQKLRDVVQNGKWILPHMDKQLAVNILALNDSTVKYVLADLITQEEIDWFLRRLHDMQAALRKEMANKNSRVFVEKDSDWNQQTYEDLMAMSEPERMKKIGDDYSHPDATNILLSAPYLTEINMREGFRTEEISPETRKLIADMEARHKAQQAAGAGA